MVDRANKITGRFYATSTGTRPVREWLLELSRDDRRIIGKAIQKVSSGGRSECRTAARSVADFGRFGPIFRTDGMRV